MAFGRSKRTKQSKSENDTVNAHSFGSSVKACQVVCHVVRCRFSYTHYTNTSTNMHAHINRENERTNGEKHTLIHREGDGNE